MKYLQTPIEGVYIIEPEVFQDSRGFFARTFCKQGFEENNLKGEFVQTNHSRTEGVGTVRGMHYQLPPFAETKLIKCIKGKIYDVIVDIRKGSPTFLQWFGVELTEENKLMLYVPEGFAHGFQTLTEEVEVVYQVSNYYNPKSERGIRYNDQLVNIVWPLSITNISQKDSNIPLVTNTFKGIKL